MPLEVAGDRLVEISLDVVEPVDFLEVRSRRRPFMSSLPWSFEGARGSG